MAISLETAGPGFGAVIRNINITAPLTDIEFSEILAAFHAHSVLIFPDSPLDDAQQVAFSQRFGMLERTSGVNPGAGSPFARQSNIDMKSGDLIAAGDRRMFYQKANMLWHADSTFKPVTSLCSVLSAREIPADGGNTEFVSTRLAYERLSVAQQNELADLVVEHDFVFSRNRVGFQFTPEEAATYPAVYHRLVRTNPVNGRKSLMLGAHAKAIAGKSDAAGTKLLESLLEEATRPEYIFSHRWRSGDVVVWDNQAVLHRATPYDNQRQRRLMQRTTISLGEVSVSPT